MTHRAFSFKHKIVTLASLLVLSATFVPHAQAQAQAAPKTSTPSKAPARPKLVVLLVVDQMRADFVDKFRGQWTGGLKRLVEEGAWFRDAAYPYAATETCVGHATISTGAFPATHGMIANAWWDRKEQKMVTCTSDPNPSVKNIGYAGATPEGADSAWRMAVPSFAEELKFQTNGATRIVSFSLKARAAIIMAGHKADATTWFDGGAWVTSSPYGMQPFIEEQAKAHRPKEDYGKTWSLSLPENAYWYGDKPLGAVPPEGWELTFPHPLRGKSGSGEPDSVFYNQWVSSPFADEALTELAKRAVDALNLGNAGGTDFLAVGYSALDHAGHAFGPRSHEVQDVLVRLDKDLGDLFAHLDQKVGRGNYVVALSADHGVAPTPEDMQTTGADSGVLHLPELQDKIEKALEPFHFPKPVVARINGSDIYFAPGVYGKLQQDPAALQAVLDAALSQPGVAAVYRAEELRNRPATQSPGLRAMAYGYFPGRSGDLFILPKPYWLMDRTPLGEPRSYGAGHSVPYNYDQHVPILFMGFGIQPGEYFQSITPADIAPTLAALCGITLAPRDGHILSEALKKPAAPRAPTRPTRPESSSASAPKPNL
ncbi:MAG TPA: alkaline phosphatase family protein [Candidatus Acidoferrum sp.]|nr:alkaline phosphatase family protein [Candidatus Acidoferrum sp.]